LRLEEIVRVEAPDLGFNLVQQLPEPQFVHLMDHDEEHLIVMRWIALKVLQRDQFIDVQVGAVGELGHELR
jgi:hypothetical protein